MTIPMMCVWCLLSNKSSFLNYPRQAGQRRAQIYTFDPFNNRSWQFNSFGVIRLK